MPDIHVSVDIQRPPEAVFKLLADIAHYRDWLPPSKTYVETTDISDTPLRQGTTYVDKNTNGTMYGSVLEYQPYSRIVFQQTGKNPHVEVTARYQLTPTRGRGRIWNAPRRSFCPASIACFSRLACARCAPKTSGRLPRSKPISKRSPPDSQHK